MDRIVPAWAQIVRRSLSRYERLVLANPPLRTSQMVHQLLKERLGREMVEVMCVICLDGQNRVLVLAEIARGSTNRCAFQVADLFRVAIAHGAVQIILAHNHPSGSVEPTQEDIQLTKGAKSAGDLLGIPVVDHVILAGERYLSFHDRGLLV